MSDTRRAKHGVEGTRHEWMERIGPRNEWMERVAETCVDLVGARPEDRVGGADEWMEPTAETDVDLVGARLEDRIVLGGRGARQRRV